MKKENTFMQQAIKLSLQNVTSGNGGPFGAVIVKDGKIIGKGYNNVTSTNDPTAHAEIEAIRMACRKIKNFDLTNSEIYTSCEPCPMCLSAIYWARISKIYFANTKQDAAKISFDDDFIYKEILKEMNLRKIPMKQMMRAEAKQAFKIWKEMPDKIPY